jgi:hypothetical protein
MVETPVAERVRAYRERKAAAKLLKVETYLSKALVKRLDAAAAREGVSRAEIVRLWLEAHAATVPTQLAKANFAALVKTTAAGIQGPNRRGRKVLIAAVWKALGSAAGDLASFKTRLIEAHRAGELVLHRCDLPRGLPAAVVQESEAAYLNATFHFIEAEVRAS